MSSISTAASITKKSSVVMLMFAVILAAAGSYGLLKLHRAMVGSVPVVVATVNIQPHTQIAPEMLTVHEYAEGLTQKGMFTSPQDAVDKITRGYIPAGTPLYSQQLADPGDNTLTTQLSELQRPDYRGKSLPVEAIVGLNGRISPGDRVDLVGALQAPLKGQQTKIAHTFAKDVEILEVIGVGEAMRGITVAVNPQQAQDMDFVINNGGKIGIALRPYNATDIVTEPTTPETFMAKLFAGVEENTTQQQEQTIRGQ